MTSSSRVGRREDDDELSARLTFSLGVEEERDVDEEEEAITGTDQQNIDLFIYLFSILGGVILIDENVTTTAVSKP